MIEFDVSILWNVKFLAVKEMKQSNEQLDFSMVMLAKVSLKSFIHEFTEIYFFSKPKNKRDF